MVAWHPPRFPHHNLPSLYRLLRLHALLCPQLHLHPRFALLSSFGSGFKGPPLSSKQLHRYVDCSPSRDTFECQNSFSRLCWTLASPASQTLHMHAVTHKIFPTSCPSCLLRYGSSFASRTQITAHTPTSTLASDVWAEHAPSFSTQVQARGQGRSSSSAVQACTPRRTP